MMPSLYESICPCYNNVPETGSVVKNRSLFGPIVTQLSSPRRIDHIWVSSQRCVLLQLVVESRRLNACVQEANYTGRECFIFSGSLNTHSILINQYQPALIDPILSGRHCCFGVFTPHWLFCFIICGVPFALMGGSTKTFHYSAECSEFLHSAHCPVKGLYLCKLTSTSRGSFSEQDTDPWLWLHVVRRHFLVIFFWLNLVIPQVFGLVSVRSLATRAVSVWHGFHLKSVQIAVG